VNGAETPSGGGSVEINFDPINHGETTCQDTLHPKKLNSGSLNDWRRSKPRKKQKKEDAEASTGRQH